MKKRSLAIALLVMAVSLAGCGSKEDAGNKVNTENMTENAGDKDKDSSAGQDDAKERKIDFDELKAQNPDIFAWLYVPGTNIDYPLLQSIEEDDYYESHGEDGAESDKGALYTEMANMMNMCDFNTIIHGKDRDESDLFYQLHRFEDPDFFETNQLFYIYLPDNVLTYTVFAAYYDDSSDILRRFDYTTVNGCESHLEKIYGTREMGKNIREGWDDLTPFHFLVTLNGSTREDEQRQYVVIGVLTDDPSGTIDRTFFD